MEYTQDYLAKSEDYLKNDVKEHVKAFAHELENNILLKNVLDRIEGYRKDFRDKMQILTHEQNDVTDYVSHYGERLRNVQDRVSGIINIIMCSFG